MGDMGCPTVRWRGLCLLLLCLLSTIVSAQEAMWIWSPEQPRDNVPKGNVHFRKIFQTKQPEGGQIAIAADDTYELFLNGRKIGSGGGTEKLTQYDIGKFVTRGRNLVSVRVTNSNGNHAGLAARVLVKERGAGWQAHSTDASWRVSVAPMPFWNTAFYNDRRWGEAVVLGRLGETAPWDTPPPSATAETEADPEATKRQGRFTVAEEFRVEKVLDGDTDKLGSLIAMTFNEFGHILAARENGPLLLIYDSNEDGEPDKVRDYCDKVKNCQGILALNGEVFVTADGPEGFALYRLADGDRDGRLEQVTTLVKFKGTPGEHGPHGVELGPDGLLYVIVGNHMHPETEPDKLSPYSNYYEGDLNQPRYEDPGGHAVGIKAPGGTVIRTDVDGQSVQVVAGGIRNAYDLAFNRWGDLFTWDSDMESDIGTSWFRPTRLFHVTPGAEFGWRSGWACWPDYFLDTLPGIGEGGRGSPTGLAFYNHHMYPTRYHDAMFLGDWSEGRILCARMKRDGASYRVETETFVEGQPLNVTDLAVGPDGSLYFVTGGRGTAGGIYRVVWKGKVPESVSSIGTGIGAAIRQPQLQSAWGRQKIAALRNDMADEWDRLIVGVARSASNPWYYRARALDLMQLFGPAPSKELLLLMARDDGAEVRAKAAWAMGLHSSRETHDRLIALLEDDDATVRRVACESLLRAGQVPPFERLVPSLASADRAEAWAARRLLERMPPAQWKEAVLETENQRLFLQGGLALMVAHPSPENALEVLQQISQMLLGFVADREFADLLRLCQVALLRGEISPDDVPQLRDQLAEEFPSSNHRMNREMARLLVFLQANTILDRYLEYLRSDAPHIERLHLALHLRFLEGTWRPQQRLELLKFYESSQQEKGGGSYQLYVANFARDFARGLTDDEVRLVLAKGAQWPNAALGVLYKLPKELDEELLLFLKELDRQVATQNDPLTERLKVGIVAVLARSGDRESMTYLREIWQRDPERRATVALGLSQVPDGDNWKLLLKSLPLLEDRIAREVLGRLRTVSTRPEDAEHFRQVILAGLRVKDGGPAQSVALLEHWTSERLGPPNDPPEKNLARWQRWFNETFPDHPEAKLPTPPPDAKWQFRELLQFLAGEEGAKGAAGRGAEIFTKAQCIKCHRFGEKGESLGPDLSSVAKRFTRREILESILYPSHVISDQYASKAVTTKKGLQYVGIVAPGAGGELTVLQSDGKKVIVSGDDVEDVTLSRASAMPDGLLNNLTLEEIADLFAYLMTPPNQRVTRAPGKEKG